MNNAKLQIDNLISRTEYLSESTNSTVYTIEIICDLLEKRDVLEDYKNIKNERDRETINANDYLFVQLENVLKGLKFDAMRTSKEFDSLREQLTEIQNNIR